MRILFSVRKPSSVRHCESVLRALAARGHDIAFVKEAPKEFKWPPFVLALAAACPGTRLEVMPTTARIHDSQEGTVHFHYLLSGPNALLHSARSHEEHARNLTAVLEGRDPDPERSARVVRAFVRPLGLQTPATRVFVQAFEALAASPAPEPVPAPAWTRLIRPFLLPFAHTAGERARRIQEESHRRKKPQLIEYRQRKHAPLLEYRQEKTEERRRRKREPADTAGGVRDNS